MKNDIGRRKFLKSSTAGITIMSAKTAFGSEANSAVTMGIIGSGNRGIHVGASFMEHTNARVTALADLFEDRLSNGKERFDTINGEKGLKKLENNHLFSGPDACKRLLDLKDVDSVLIASPHFVHPGQTSMSVDAGKHVYLEKPVAVDVRGCREIMWAGRKAEGKLSFAVGFQIRNASPFVNLMKRIQDGDIGDIVMAQTWYFAGAPKRTSPSSASADERRVRLWALDRALSGDNILLQGVHVLDTCNWLLGGHPVKASGTCGRKARSDEGNNNSFFLVNYEYPGGMPLSLQTQQFDPGYGDVCERFFGTKGIAEAHYSGGVFIKGENEWDSGVARGTAEEISAKQWQAGAFRSALDDADQNKEKAFIDSITSGKFLNEAKSGAESTLTAILGSVAAYGGEEITWDELLASDYYVDPMVDISKLG